MKQNNEQLKAEMASLRAMLKAQADGAASKQLNAAELEEKEEEIKRLTARVKQLEELLEQEKATVEKIKAELRDRPTVEVPVPAKSAVVPIPGSPEPHKNINQSGKQDEKTSSVDSKVLEEHKIIVDRLEKELAKEKSAHRLVDAQLVQLKAKMAGVELTQDDFEGFLTSDERSPTNETVTKKKQGLANLGSNTMKGLKSLAKRVSIANKDDIQSQQMMR